MTTNLPTIGAALMLPQLERLHNWVLEGRRDLELQDFTDAETLEGDWRPAAARARALLDGFEGRLGIHGPFWGFSIATPDLGVRDVVRRRVWQGLDVCEALGATHMVIHSPYSSWDHNNLPKRPGDRARLLDNCHLALRDAVNRAEQAGVMLVIENIEDKDPAARVELAASFDSPAVKVSLDTGHAHYAHGSTGAPPVDYYVRAAGDALAHVHLQDADGYADRHWLPGQGTIHWHAVFAALRDCGSNPRLILELADMDRVREAADWLIGQGLAR